MDVLPALWTLLSFQTSLAAGLPLVDTKRSTAITVGWVSDPSQRGTPSIITSCILTMGLCVWSALHLNIPPRQQGVIQFWLQNVKWMLMGLLAPELVVFAAWRQYVSAKTLQDKINGLSISRTRPSTVTAASDKTLSEPEVVASCNASHWTLVHSFYAGMGGFAFDLNTASASVPLPSNLPSGRLTLTPRGIAFLAECGLLPRISREEIGDKNKTDGLAKALVCLQAGWMMIQVVGRVAYGLPVTLLEINTLGHVICALVIYVLWWHKPHLVNEPTCLQGQWVEAVCTYMWMSSRISDPCEDEMFLFGGQAVPELAKLAFYPCRPIGDIPGFSCPEPTPERVNSTEKSDTRESAAPFKDSEDSSLAPSTRFAYKEHFGYLRPKEQHQSPTSTHVTTDESQKASLPPLGKDVPPERWRLALDAMQMFPAICKRLKVDTNNAPGELYRFHVEELLCDRVPNWHSKGLLTNMRGVLMGMALWFASMAFGGVHAAAWNGYFPSTLECWLWRSCSVYIMASGLIWLCINFLGQVSRSFDEYWDNFIAGRASWISYVIIGFLCTICGLAYGFARIFLIIEAVISLRRLPSAAYNTPDWSQVIPHL